MLSRTRRLLGFAKSSTHTPLVYDSRLRTEQPPHKPPAPDWQNDLDSLYRQVDAHMARRRPAKVDDPYAGLMVPAPAEPEPARAPDEMFVGFGLEDPDAAAAGLDADDVDLLLERVVEELRHGPLHDDLTAAMREAAREAVAEALSGRLGDAVRESVNAALGEAAARRSASRPDPPPAAPAPPADQPPAFEAPRPRPSTVLSIRFRRRAPRELPGADASTLKIR